MLKKIMRFYPAILIARLIPLQIKARKKE